MHWPKVGLVKDRLPNGAQVRLWSRGDDYIANRVFWYGWSGFEPELSGLFFELCRTSRVTIDVGAHIGFYSLLAALANPQGTVLAFEPLPAVHQRFVRNLAAHRVSNVEVIQAAAGDEAGTAKLYHVPHGIPSCSSLDLEVMKGWYNDVAATEVPILTIDSLADGLHVDLVKIDTEASEDRVLRGMRQTLERCRPTIACEVLTPMAAAKTEEALDGLGYEFLHLTPQGPVKRPKILADADARNYLFTIDVDGVMAARG